MQGVPNENWGLCNLNEKYGLCATYPKRLFVPTKAPQSVIEGSARFRSKSRLPVLTYLHKNGAAIIRCAQPLVGVSGSRSPQVWLPDDYSRTFRSYVFGPSGFKTMAPLRCKIWQNPRKGRDQILQRSAAEP